SRGTGTDKRGRDAGARVGAGIRPAPATEGRDQTMQNVQAIIDLFGGLARLRHIRLEAPGFMPLVIEAVGTGPRGLPLVSVAHYYEQQGDLMRDPELTCEVGPDGTFHPVSFTQDNVGAYHEAVFVDEAG